MRISGKSRTVLLTIIFFLFLPCILTFIAVFFALLIEQALAGGGPYVSEILMYIANWPSLVLKIYPTITTMHGTKVYSLEHGLLDPLAIIVNAIGWGLVGFIIGLIISVIKGRKKEKHEVKKE
jgi:hypothetical protein